MGFLDYAWTVSFQKDNTKVKILKDYTINQPTIATDDYGFAIKLPSVDFQTDGKISFLGQVFPQSSTGKSHVGRMFRAAVIHLTTHTLTSLPKEKIVPDNSDPITTAFAKSLVRDVFVNTYLQAWYPDRFNDLAFASAMIFQKIKPAQRIFAPSTRIMTALLTKFNVGLIKGSLALEEQQQVDLIFQDLAPLKDNVLSSLAGEQVNLEELFDEKVKVITNRLEPFGPFLEAPSLPHTENIGKCSIFTESELPVNSDFENIFIGSLETLGGTVPAVDNIEQLWRPEQEAEAFQVFESDKHLKERQERIASKISQYALSLTRFKSVSFPGEDYTQYLRARSLLPGTSRRLLETLRSALNLLDEDPRQEMGQLDLSAVIQAMASSKPATDVFSLDEYLKQSFAWSIIFDVSSSMNVRGEYARALAISVGEAARELMQDPTSWTFFAFSDRFYILKDSTESYSKTVRARIGGLKFDGLTYIPDAIQMAGKMLAKRFEEQRVLIVISDGWPYGYPNMPIALKECVDDLLRKNVIVIGIGVETKRMGNFFKLNTSVYTQKDLINKFAQVYIDASAKAIET